MGTFFIIFIIFGIIVVGGFVVLIAFIIKKSTEPKSEAYIAKEKKKLFNNVIKKRKTLSTHTSPLYAEITDAMSFNYVKSVTYAKLSGVILNEKRKPIVAFERIERGFDTKGHMYAMSKKREFYYEFTGLEATFYCDGKLLGRFDKEGIIYDHNNQRIGKAKHPIKASFEIEIFKKVKHRLGEGLFPLVINDRELATINVVPNYDDIDYGHSVDILFDELEFGTPIITLSKNIEPTVDEEKWLSAFAIFETAFHGHWLIP
ncbi:hypothetical protein [Kordia jejudonensis]|uniref:hypothetical protein n=1 Tax=Kordia jejudonensis TaxID=1348245 RepID=UPI0006295417|nr:hypothetical protein [Kordia jejudonensis]